MKNDVFVYRNLDNWSWTDRTSDEYVDINNVNLEKFIKEHPQRIHWVHLIANQELSEEFINKYFDKLWNWDKEGLLTYQNLSEELLEKYKDRFNDLEWSIIAGKQKLSLNFIKKHIREFEKWCTSTSLLENPKISQADKNEFLRLINDK